MRDHTIALSSKIQHGLISVIEPGTSHSIVCFCIGCVHADGNAVNDCSKVLHDISAVLEITQTIGIQPGRQMIILLHIGSNFQQRIQCTGRLAIAAEDKFVVAGEIKGINGRLDFLDSRVAIVLSVRRYGPDISK